mgnify:CR=1 FL=1
MNAPETSSPAGGPKIPSPGEPQPRGQRRNRSRGRLQHRGRRGLWWFAAMLGLFLGVAVLWFWWAPYTLNDAPLFGEQSSPRQPVKLHAELQLLVFVTFLLSIVGFFVARVLKAGLWLAAAYALLALLGVALLWVFYSAEHLFPEHYRQHVQELLSG